MRRHLSRIVRALAAAAIVSVAAGCAVRGPDVVKTATPVKIDGVLDEPCWSSAAPVIVDTLHGAKGMGRTSEQPRMIVKYAWDDHYFYIGYETFDTNIQAAGRDSQQGPPKNRRQTAENYKADGKLDVVEFFISFGDPHVFWEIHHNALNQFSDVLIISSPQSWPIHNSSMAFAGIYFAGEEYVKDEGAYTVARAVRLKPKADGMNSTPNNDTDTDTGLTGEIRLPWEGIGAPNDWRVWYSKEIPGQTEPYRWPGPWDYIAGKEIIVLAVCQNADHPVAYSHSSPRHIPNWFHKAWDVWPRYRLVKAPPK